jgi:glucokinase
VNATIGLDVGGTKILGVVVDAEGRVLEEVREPTPASDGPELVRAMTAAVGALRARHPDVRAIGAGIAGAVTRDGVVRYSPNLPGLIEAPIGKLLAEATGVPVRTDNDATCALWAEHVLGAAAGASDVLFVALGTGIGGGLIIDGKLVTGAHGFAGEIGHMVVVVDGVPCVCGRLGCWERYASGTALGGEGVTLAARAGDVTALRAFDELAGWVAVGLVNLVQALDVERIVIGGGLAEAADLLLPRVRTAYDERAIAPDHRPPVDIVAASLGERAGAIGAALLAQRDR